MSIDPKQISKRIAEIVNKFRLLWRYMTLGPTSLKTHEIKLLIKEGMLHPKHYKPTIDDAYIEAHLDLLTRASKKSVRDYSIKHLKESAGKYIDKFAEKTTAELSSIVNNNLLMHAQRLQEITKDTVAEAIEQRKTARQIVQLLKDRTNDLYKDWDRVVTTELGNAQNLGAVDAMIANNANKKQSEIYCYKNVVSDERTCKYCKKFWLMPDGITPRVYKLSELLANGSNYGKKAAEWLPTSGLSHPNCREILLELPQSWGFKNGALVYIKEGHSEYDKQNS